MDSALPPGGLDRVFAQYDHIVSHRPGDPSTAPEEPPANEPPADEPPWWTPEEPAEPDIPPDISAPVVDEKPSYSSDVAQIVGAGAIASGLRGGAVEGLEALAEPLLGGEVAAVAEAGAATGLLPGIALGAAGIAGLNYVEDHMPSEESFDTPVQPGEVTFEVDGKTVPAKTFHETKPQKVASQPVSFKRDEEGLDQAYANPKGTYYDPATQTEYVKGSHDARDWFDDFTTVPFGNTAYSHRYDQAMQAYNDLNASGQPVSRLVGHSLGGSAVLEMEKNLASKGRPVTTRTFGAPVFDPLGAYSKSNAERYKHWGDPVAAFDTGATHGKFELYPHTYTNYENLAKA